ncbi:MAG: DUF1549 domain-containing protein, partial [Armatimonadetes bacterium]|nr:DUF1549 domain-containing protein [Armatimonadota bacterium]
MNTWDRRKWVGVRLAGLAAALAVGASAAAGVGGAPRFERDVLPVLQANCVSCHGEAVRQGGLDLRTPASLRRGGRGGPAVALGAPEKSPVFRRAANGTMPPGNARKLNASELDLLRRWIRAGAPEGAALPAGSAASAGKNHWAFQPVRLPAVPRVRNGAWVRNPVDAFILARLEARGLSGPGEAAPRVLLRRLYLDLLGLPPTPEEQEAYLADRSPERYERWVDRLLARPEYGERWGRRWLDVARYAESNGYERDGTKPHAWRYRDYVIQSLNADKPADRFLVEQIAGDELPDTNAEAQIATTFLRLGTWDDEPAEPAVDRYDQLDDVLGVTATAFMGLTLRCARCHDHKFEPISQKDYYRTLAVFMPLQRPQRGRTDLDVLAGTRTELANYHRAVEEAGRRTAADQERLWRVKDGILSRLIATGKNKLPTEATTAFRTGPAARNAAQRKLVEQHSEAVERELRKEQTAAETAERGEIEARIQAASPPEPPRAYLWKEEGPVPETRVLRRGDPQHPEDRVGPEIPSALAAFPAGPLQPTGPSSGRRLWFARWLASPTHPLTGRVLVNRIWQGHFGEGLVPSENDFGVAGQRPTHPELLDWLAYRFTAAAPAGMGWSWKRLHRTILL